MANKIVVEAQVELGGTLPPHNSDRANPDTAGTLHSATLAIAQIANPFVGVAELAPMESEIRDLAARDPGVQLKETHQVQFGAPHHDATCDPIWVQ